MRKLYVVIFISLSLILFQNLTPFFPRNNVNTVVIKKQGIDNKYRTTTPQIPANEFSRDGLLALRRRALGTAIFFPMKPDRVVNNLQDPANSLSGANIMNPNDFYVYDYFPIAKNYLSPADKAIAEDGFSLTQTLFCEKTNTILNPQICDRDFDCYRMHLVGKLSQPLSAAQAAVIKSDEATNLRLISLEVLVKIQNPKSNAAKIVSVTPYDPDGSGPLKPTAKLSDLLENYVLNEPTIAGDNRLLVARVGSGVAHYKDTLGQPKTLNNANIIYSVYDEDIEPCDVTQWTSAHPITYAPYDRDNNMPTRYKFARSPFTDSAGNRYVQGSEFGGSYPWMDRKATNLFFTAFGTDSFYSVVDNKIKTPYSITAATGSLISIDRSTSLPTTPETIPNYEVVGSRTMGVGFVGFWTHGRSVILDGLVNNTDYNFTIASERTEGINISPTVNRSLALYTNTPDTQINETVGAGRERGDEVNTSFYDSNVVTNSTFMGSIENRLNYNEKIKPITARDIVWHFGTMRHQEELVFDDYINPYFLINAEMTGVAAIDGTNRNRSMKHFDGYNSGDKSTPFTDLTLENTNIISLANSAPVLFQNSSTGPVDFIKPPYFGIPIGDVRLEPIAKGGIFGKGVWLEKNAGLSFYVPTQNSKSIIQPSLPEPAIDRYISVFIDPRFDPRFGAREQLLFSHWLESADKETIQLIPVPTALYTYSGLIFKINDVTLAQFTFPEGFTIPSRTWSNIGVQFSSNMPQIYLNGMYIGSAALTVNTPSTRQQLRRFFNPQAKSRIILGNSVANQLLGIRGWFDDFKMLLRNPTSEEKCNYARGTIVKVKNALASNTPAAQLAKKYPLSAHRGITSELKEDLAGQRYYCHTKYSAEGSITQPLNIEPFAHLKNIPGDTISVRHKLLMESQQLVYNQNRPDFTKNRFCLSCHLSPDYITSKALNTNALTAGTVMEQDDIRRQPMQPPPNIRGIIPANYFAPGVPATTLKLFTSEKIDQWILPEP